jgi:replicative DNA helicase
VYEPESEHKGTAELLIEKNRHGPTGFVRCAWLAETMRFANLGVAA